MASKPAEAKQPIRRPRRRDVVVVCANLEELYDEVDLAEAADMRMFVDAVARAAPRHPDIVLLQEVVEPVVQTVARLLRRKTRKSYNAVVRPAIKARFSRTQTGEVVRDTAILVNSATMEAVRKGGFIRTRHDPAHNAAKAKGINKQKDHAHVLARHKPTGTEMVLASVHLVPNTAVSAEVGSQYRNRWSQQLCRNLSRSYPSGNNPRVHIIAGDFNNRRHKGRVERIDSPTHDFWSFLTDEARLKDAVLEACKGSDEALLNQYRRKHDDRAARIDYIFTDAEVIAASVDTDATKVKTDPDFYSDHALVWAKLRLP